MLRRARLLAAVEKPGTLPVFYQWIVVENR
jgi:hypothetical protein